MRISWLMSAVCGLALLAASGPWVGRSHLPLLGRLAVGEALSAEPSPRGEKLAAAALAQDASQQHSGLSSQPAKPKAVKKIYIMTDMEGVAGVRDSENWCGPDGRYYDVGQKLLTLEVNAAIDGFCAGGAEDIVVGDGHGRGAVNIELLDPRAQLERGWPAGWPGPSLATGRFDAIAWVGQHAKAGTPLAHLAHTQGWSYIDLSVNGVSIGEFGQLALCASELGVRSIFATGDKAFTEEAQALAPGIETVCVKRGTTPGGGDELTSEQYGRRNTAAVHLQPEKARALIREGAERAIRRAQTEQFGLVQLKPPFERVARFRPANRGEPVLISRESHASSVIELMNLPFHRTPAK